MTPTEAIASIRASIAAGYSPSLSDIEVLIAECGRVEGLKRENADLRQLRARIYNPKIMEGYRAVSRKPLFDALMLIDPPPFEHDGKTVVFKNPYAGEVLIRLSALIREMAAPEPAPTYEEALALTTQSPRKKMDKQERDRLREYANNHLNGRESDFTFFTPVEVLALLDHIDALLLEQLESLRWNVKRSHAEGYYAGIDFLKSNPAAQKTDYPDAWERSIAKKALAQAEEKAKS